MSELAKKRKTKGSRVGDDLVEAFQQIAAHMRGEIEVESYEVADDRLTPRCKPC